MKPIKSFVSKRLTVFHFIHVSSSKRQNQGKQRILHTGFPRAWAEPHNKSTSAELSGMARPFGARGLIEQVGGWLEAVICFLCFSGPW